MTNERRDLTVVDPWGEKSQMLELGERLRVMLPGGQALNPDQAMALAQYSKLADANPFRGEIYAAVIRGKLVFVDGYKLLVRWARRQCNYTDFYVEWDNERKVKEQLTANDIGFTCYILRDDQKHIVKDFVSMGATFQEAYDRVAFSASGVVTKREDMTTNNNTYNQPPKGWTWADVAKKRALKNALNLSHGAPSPSEISKESWMVDNTETIDADWQNIPEFEQDPEVKARYAKLSALTRNVVESQATMTLEQKLDQLAQNTELLRGQPENGIGEPFDETQDAAEEPVLVTEDFFDETPLSPIPDFSPPPKWYTHDQAKEAILAIAYDTESTLNLALKTLLNKDSLDQLNEIELWNMVEYVKRRALLKDTTLGSAPQRMMLIPEIKDLKEKPDTLREAGEFMHNVLRLLCSNGKTFRQLTPDAVNV